MPIITATKTDALITDNDSDNNADPGDALRYTVTLGFSGTDATGVVFSDTVDPNTAFVPGSLRTTPLARPDSYTASGNIRINLNAASGVLANDQDFDGVGPAVTVTAGVFLSTNGGNVNLSADGSFSYNPPAGFEGSDSFSYTLNDNDTPNQTDTSTVTITVSGMIWFINNNAGSPGDGRLTNPFNTLAAFEAVNGNGGNNPAANDNIFIYESATAYTGPVTLESNQKVIGQDANGGSLDALAGITLAPHSDPLPALSPGGTLVTITSGNAVAVAQGNTLRGFTVGASTTDISGSNFGTLTMFDISLNGGGQALNLTNGNLSATSNISIASTSGATGISLNDVGGSLTTTGTTSISGSTGNGIFIQSSRTGALFNFGNTSVTTTGGVGVRLDNNVGNVTFAGLDITPNAGQRALHATNSVANSGTITTTSGTISASNAIAVEVNRTAGTIPLVMSLTSVSANGGSNGIVLTNTNGSFSITGDGGSANNGSGGTIQNHTSHGIALSNAQNISLDQVNIQSIARSGINGTLVDNFTLTNSTLNNTGTSGTADIANSAVFFANQAAGSEQNLTGVVTITGNTLTAMKHHGISIANFAGTISDANISTNTITSPTTTATSTGSGIQILSFATNAATKAHLTKATINDNDVFNFPSDAGISVQCQNVAEGSIAGTCGTNSTTNAVNITNNTVAGQSAANRIGTQGILFNANGTVTAFFNVTGNSVSHTAGNSISHNVFGDSVVNSVTSNNTVVSNNSLAAGGIEGGIGATGGYLSNTASLSWKLENNNVSATDGNGIRALSGLDDTDGTLNITIRNNTVAAPVGVNQGIAVRHNGNAAADPTICLDISGNTSAGGGGSLGIGLRKAGINAAVDVFGIEGLAPSPATAAQTVTFVNGQNPAGGGTTIISGDNFVSCGVAPNAAIETTKSITGSEKIQDNNADTNAPESVPVNWLDRCYEPRVEKRGGVVAPTPISDERSTDEAAKKGQGDKQGILSAPAGEGIRDDRIQKLSQRDLSWMIQVAINTWREAGISIEEIQRMEAVKFELADLPNGQLAVETSSSVEIDETAASYGWFVDYSPQDNSEFEVPVPGRELQLTDSSSAYGRIDLLTVVLRALAPKLSQDNLKNFSLRSALMNGTLGPGVRRLPVLTRPGISKPQASGAGVGRARSFAAAAVSAKSKNGASYLPLANRRTSGKMKHHATFSPRASATLADVMINMGLVPAGKTITITFEATVDDPWQGASNQVCNQGTVTADGGISVQTDDPSVGGPADPTCTTIDQPDVTLAVSPASVAEDGGNLVYTFTREGSTAGSLTVNFSVGGTATFNTDYTQTGAATFTPPTGTVTIPSGSSTASVTVDPTADSTVESDETVVLTVTSGTSYDVGTPSVANGTITNDDTDVSVAVSPASVNEDDAPNLVYTFTRVGVTSSPLTVNFSVGGTATFGVDYGQTGATTFTLTNGTVDFAAGSSTATVTVDPTTDTFVEPNETVELTVTTGTGYNVGTPSTATGTITNDETEVTIAVSPSTVEEDGATDLTYTFTRTGDITGALVVNFTIGGTATFGASPNDYTQTGATTFTPPNGTVTFSAGSPTASIIVNPETDTTPEPNETVTLTLAASVDYNIGTPNSATGTINNDDTTVSVAVSPGAVDEDGGTNLVYTFTRSDSDGALTANFSIGGTATFNTDYTQTGAASFVPPSGTVTFADGSLTATVTVDPSADTTAEPDESVILTVVAGAGYAVGAPSSATGTITNDDTEVSVAVAPSSTLEDGAGNLVYTFTRVGVTTGALTVNFTIGGTATFNDDYTQTGATTFSPPNGTVDFSAGSSTATVTVDPTPDNTVEPDETVILSVAAGTGYNVAAVNNSATGTITNDDTDVSIAVAPTSVNEDGATNLVYTFTRVGATSTPLTVNFTIGGTATFGASPNDYTQTGATTFTPPNGTVTFSAGNSTATITVNPETDTTTEPDETVILTLAAGTGYNVVEPSSATGTILDDDIVVSVAVSPGAADEDGAGNLVYTFTRPDSNGALTVNFSIGGTATFGTDYTQTGAATFTPPTGTVTFADGSLTATVTVDPSADLTVESDETVTLTVTAGAGYTVGAPASATGTITNDDTDLTVAVSPLSTTEDGAGNLVYTFTRNGVTASALTVNFSIGGTATFNTDYTQSGAASFTPPTGTVTFIAGSSTATVTVDPTADAAAEADETVILTLTPGTGYNVASPSAATGTITNDDTEVSVTVAPASVLEDGATNMVFTFTRVGITTGALTVDFSVGGSAVYAPPGGDYTNIVVPGDTYTATSGTVNFSAGSSTATVTIDPFGDADQEPDDTVILTVVPGAGYTVGTPSSATGTILNDDNSPPTIVVGYGQCGGGSSTGTMNLTVGDVETAPGSLTMSATSSNTAVVPLANISFGGSGANRTVTINAVPQTALAFSDVTITVTDGNGLTTSINVRVIIGTNHTETITLNTTPGGVTTVGSDLIFGRNGDDTINAGAGNDLVCGGNSGGIINGGFGDDTLDGGNGNDTLRGSDGNDLLLGGNGTDTLQGEAGDDTLTGGSGPDSFSGGLGNDTATDFSAGQGDTQDGTVEIAALFGTRDGGGVFAYLASERSWLAGTVQALVWAYFSG